MKKLFIRGSLLLIILLVVDKPIGWMISKWAQERQYDDRIGKLGRQELLPEILIIGSSRALNDIDAGELENVSGKKVYGLGFSGSNHAFHNSILQMALETSTPECVILTIDQGTSFIPNDKSIYRKDLLFPFAGYPIVSKEITRYSKKIFWLGQICWMYRENNNLITALNYLKSGQLDPDMTSDIDNWGSVLLDGRSPNFKAFHQGTIGDSYDRTSESEKLLENFEEIIATCLQQGIRLILVQPPHLFKSYAGFNERLNELVQNRAEIIDMSDLHLEESMYFDAGHLNRAGASIFTKELYARIYHGI